MSPHLFAVYIDDVIRNVHLLQTGCYLKQVCISILLYADDILLLSPSVEGLQQLVSVCETGVNSLGLDLNYRESVCMRIGPRFLACCVNIKTLHGVELAWMKELRYLGIYLVSSSKFKCNYANARHTSLVRRMFFSQRVVADWNRLP